MSTGHGYHAGHPWYYKLGGEILEPGEIEPAEIKWLNLKNHCIGGQKLSRKRPEAIAAIECQLGDDVMRYLEIAEKKNAACSEYDLRMGYNWTMAISLKHNHIAYVKGLLKLARRMK